MESWVRHSGLDDRVGAGLASGLDAGLDTGLALDSGLNWALDWTLDCTLDLVLSWTLGASELNIGSTLKLNVDLKVGRALELGAGVALH